MGGDSSFLANDQEKERGLWRQLARPRPPPRPPPPLGGCARSPSPSLLPDFPRARRFASPPLQVMTGHFARLNTSRFWHLPPPTASPERVASRLFMDLSLRSTLYKASGGRLQSSLGGRVDFCFHPVGLLTFRRRRV